MDNGLEGFKKEFYAEADAKNIKKKYKQGIDKSLESLYSVMASADFGLSGHERKEVSKRMKEMFWRSFISENGFLDFFYLDSKQPVKESAVEEAFNEVVSYVSEEEKNFRELLERAKASGNPPEYTKIFTRTDDIESSKLVHNVIKGRKKIAFVKKYEKSGKEDEIEKLIYDVINEVSGSANKLVETSGIEIDKDAEFLYRMQPELHLRSHLINKSTLGEKDILKDKGFLVVPYKQDEYFAANLDSIYQINGCLPVYIITKAPDKNSGGFYNPYSKKLFVVKTNSNIADCIQHETEHFIHHMLNLDFFKSPLHGSATEYGAYLGEMRFSDDSNRVWRENINRLGKKGEINEQEPHYAAKLNIGRTLMTVRRIKEIFMNGKKKGIEILPSADEIMDLHDQFYLKNAGISYTNLEKMCK